MKVSKIIKHILITNLIFFKNLFVKKIKQNLINRIFDFAKNKNICK